MSNIDYRNKKAICVELIKIIKSPEFFNNLEKFDDLFHKAKIDINQIIDKKRLTGFLEYTFSSYEKFFYLVDKYKANYHLSFATSEYSFTPSLKLFDTLKHVNNSFSNSEQNHSEENKIFEKIKKDKYTWLDERMTTFIKDDEKKISHTIFFNLYFTYYQLSANELDSVLNFNFDEPQLNEKFNNLKENLALELLNKSVFHYKRYLSDNIKVNPSDNLNKSLPILIKHNLINKNLSKIQEKIIHMFDEQVELDRKKTNSLHIIESFITHQALPVSWFNEIDFCDIYVSHLCKTLQNNLNYNKEGMNQGYSMDNYLSYPPTIFEESLKALDKLESLGINTYISANHKKELLNYLSIMQDKRPSSMAQKKYKEYDLMKELIILKNETPSTKINTKKIKI